MANTKISAALQDQDSYSKLLHSVWQKTSWQKTSLAKQIRGWINSCDNLHGATCQASPNYTRPEHQIPRWVVDLQERCLVPGRDVSRYVALSYVWPHETGAASRQQLMLEVDNLDQYTEPGGLYDSAMANMPKAITDFIELLLEVGERYLWVDCLCIVQDDLQTSSQVALIDEAYSGAYFTLIAARDDGGLIPEAAQSPEGFGPFHISKYHDVMLHTKWASRGWTFQEHILSKRAVVFLNASHSLPHHGDLLFWECERSVWDDNLVKPGSEEDHKHQSHMLPDIGFAPWPDFGAYMESICRYNHRAFTYPQDVLVAFSGLLNQFGRSFRGGFVSGIPQAFLHEVLLWQPHSPAERRVPREGGSLTSTIKLPSWSWCGWKCYIDPYSLRVGLDYAQDMPYRNKTASWRIIPTVEWEVLSDDFRPVGTIAKDGVIAQSRALLERHGLDNVESGWSSHPESGSAERDLSPRYFTHSHDPKRRFRYPLPEQIKSSPCVHTPGAYLSGQTTKCDSLVVRRSFADRTIMEAGGWHSSIFDIPDIRPRLECALLTLEDKDHVFAGVLRSMEDKDVSINDRIELVAISAGCVNINDLAQWNFYGSSAEEVHLASATYRSFATHQSDELTAKQLERPFYRTLKGEPLDYRMKPMDLGANAEGGKSSDGQGRTLNENTQKGYGSPLDDAKSQDVYHFYNVLWVEWQNGVAYRKGSGRIKKDVWEKHCSEPTTVVLG